MDAKQIANDFTQLNSYPLVYLFPVGVTKLMYRLSWMSNEVFSFACEQRRRLFKSFFNIITGQSKCIDSSKSGVPTSTMQWMKVKAEMMKWQIQTAVLQRKRLASV